MAQATKRTRSRASTVKADKAKVVERVLQFYRDDIADRGEDIEARLQRYAKFRMWTEGRAGPWEGSSDVGLSDMATASHRMQDTLHNAVMSSRPPVNAKAFKRSDAEKQANVDQLLDYQFFVENQGETNVGEMAKNFINDGVVRVFVPWITEERSTHDIRVLPAIPADKSPGEYFALTLMQVYPRAQIAERDKAGWSWTVVEADEGFDVEFYTLADGRVEMDAERVAEVFDGPCVIVKDYEDVVKPARARNLQAPSPSNPGGAAHFILVGRPTLDEIKRLIKTGYYDHPDAETRRQFGLALEDTTEGQELQVQRDAFAGVTYQPASTTAPGETKGIDPGLAVNEHKRLTVLMCFDIYDIDGDGESEDVIWWVVKETKTLLRARELTQVFPSNPPRRPVAEAELLPDGVSLLELMEPLHDLSKQIFDQAVDGGTMTLIPWGLYRQTSSMRPEVIRYSPGELYGTADPKNDVAFPQQPQAGNNFGFNMLAMLQTMEERLTTVGDLQVGRVPQGKASALRTVRGMQTIMQQGDARPERILRRFFMCLTEVFAQMHELNQAFLPRGKQYRIAGMPRPGEDPYRVLEDPAMIRGRFQFDFNANPMNTSKMAMQEALGNLAGLYLTPLAIQLGVVTPDGAYQLLRDIGRSFGQDADRYLSPPTPESMLPKMLAEDVITTIMNGEMPEGRPLEPAEEHMAKLMDFAFKQTAQFRNPHTGETIEGPAISSFTPQQTDIFKAYLSLLRQRVAEERRRAMLVQAAGGQGGMPGQAGVPGPVPGPGEARQSGTPLGQGELADETLPGAGGGGNTMPVMQ